MQREEMTFQELEQIMRVLEAAPRDGTVKVRLDGMTVKVSRGERASAPEAVYVPVSAPVPNQPSVPVPNEVAAPVSASAPAAEPAPEAASEPAAAPVPAAQAPADAAGHTVASPLTGVFYRQPAPDAEPFVSTGQRVEAGEVIAIIEVMKLMNRLTAPVSGIVREVCAENEQLVEVGARLFVIDPEGVAS